MERRIKRFYYNASTERVQFEMASDYCEPKTMDSRQALVTMLTECCQNQNNLHCDTEFLEKAFLTFEGNRWILRGEALVPKRVETL